jgi:hypothetical protein
LHIRALHATILSITIQSVNDTEGVLGSVLRTTEVSLGTHSVVLTRAVALLWCDISNVPFEPETPHPSLAYQVAMEGVSYPKVFDIVGIGPDDLAVAGEIRIDVRRPVRIGCTYEVSAVIAGIEHKVGSNLGAFERLEIV